MVATPERPSPTSFTVTWPPVVLASDGSIVPRVVVKETTVPLCTGVPVEGVAVAAGVPVPSLGAGCWPLRIRTAMMSVDPLIGRTFVVA